MDTTFLLDIIERKKALVSLYIDALTAVTTGGVESYTLDTGQTRQTVTRSDSTKIQGMIDAELNAIAMLEARLTGGNVTHGVPGW